MLATPNFGFVLFMSYWRKARMSSCVRSIPLARTLFGEQTALVARPLCDCPQPRTKRLSHLLPDSTKPMATSRAEPSKAPPGQVPRPISHLWFPVQYAVNKMPTNCIRKTQNCCNDLGRNVFIEGPELGFRAKAFCLIKGVNRLHSRVMVIDPEKVIYVMFSIFLNLLFPREFTLCLLSP